MNPLLLTDFYKTGHISQYPKNTTLVYSNFTPRKSRIYGINEVVFFGLQYFIKKYLIEEYNNNFFNKPLSDVVDSYKRILDNSLGGYADMQHVTALHKLGYMPIEIKALPEGSLVPMRVPMLTIKNTLPDFYWVTNFLETILSTTIWGACTSATISLEYKKILNKYADETIGHRCHVPYQAHDFSFRGMYGLEAALISGAGHLLNFVGTDTIPAISFLEQYYKADSNKELIGSSVPATEHSVMCMGGEETETETYKRLLTEIYPIGIISIVSDTWNLWDVLTKTLVELKDIILQRNGKLVVRPDSGNPVKIICGGDVSKGLDSLEYKGVVEILWDIFGGNVNEKGYKILDSHIGCIYGDSITLERCKEICERLKLKGFASSNIIFGVGSYTFQYTTRDTFGFAVKSTYGEIAGEAREIFKDPITDNVGKKSAKGLLKVVLNKGKYELIDQVSKEEEEKGELKTIFKDGILIKECSLYEIRERLLLSMKN